MLLTLLEIALSPALWVALLFIWAWRRFDGAFKTVITRTFNRELALPGQLFSDGNPVTSKTEMRVRAAMSGAGFRLARQGTAIWTLADHRGMPHKYTPDIILPAEKLIVEVDPEYTHGGAVKIADDLLRNQMYADIGYRVVRLRMGGAKALSHNDVVIASSDYTDDVTPRLIAACRKAKWIPASMWENARRRFDAMAETEKAEKAAISEITKAANAQRRNLSRPA